MKIYRPDGRCNIAGIQIKLSRENLKLSQEQLAVKIQLLGYNITQQSISRIETGDRLVADFELKYFAQALNVSILYLLGEKEI